MGYLPYDDEREAFNEEDRVATYQDAMNEFADNAGADNKDQAWLLTDYDVWVKNPHYAGPPVRHPEEYDDEEVEPVIPHLIDEDMPF